MVTNFQHNKLNKNKNIKKNNLKKIRCNIIVITKIMFKHSFFLMLLKTFSTSTAFTVIPRSVHAPIGYLSRTLCRKRTQETLLAIICFTLKFRK